MKTINLFNRILIISSSIINTVCLVLTLIGRYDANALVCLSYYFLMIVPIILKKTKFKLPDFLEMIYLLFVIIACLFGSVLKFYGLIYWFDSLVHYISGIFTALFGFFLLIKLDKYQEKTLLFNIIFVIFTVLAVAACWEIFEFTADLILGGNAQRVVETGVTDTMKDIICALLGGFLVSIVYAYEKINNKKLLISVFISNL